MKHHRLNQFIMAQKSKVKKEIITTEPDDKKFIKYPYVFTSPNVYNKDISFLNVQDQTLLYSLQYVELSQMSDIKASSKGSSETNVCNKKEEIKHKKVHFNIPNNLVIANKSNNIIPETPELSFESNSPYCSKIYDFINSQNFLSLTNIIQSLGRRSTYSTQPQISECLTVLQSNTEEIISSLDKEIDYSKLSEDINQSFQDLKSFSLNNQNNKLAAIALDNSVLFKSKQAQDEVNVLFIKCENHKRTISQNTLCEEQLVKNSVSTSNTSINFISQKQISGLQTDTDAISSSLNMLLSNKVVNSDLNFNNTYFSDENTPVTNQNIVNKKIKNLFVTATEICNNNYDFEGKKIVLEEFLMNQHLNKKSILDNITPTLSTDDSMYSIQNLDYISQNVHHQFMMNNIYNNSGISSILSNNFTSINLYPLYKQKPSYNIEIFKLEDHGNEFRENCSLKPENQIMNSITSQNIENKSKEFHSQSILLSLPLTQDSVECMLLPSSIFLSNYCCEYDKAYTKKDLKPISYRNYYSNKIINSLKEHFDKAIAPKQSLEAFFKVTGNVFEQFEVDLHKTVDNILLVLENESDENS